MAHKPSAFVCDPKHAGELQSTHAFFACGDKVRRKQPFVKRDMRALVKRANAYGELFAAFGAMIPARTHALSAELAYGIHLPAIWANQTIRPARSFQKLSSFIFVSESRICQIAHWPALLCKPMWHRMNVQSS